MEAAELVPNLPPSKMQGSAALDGDKDAPGTGASRRARLVEILTIVAEAATLVGVTSSLLVFFGSVYTSAFFSYFGVANIPDYSVQDQLKFSADVLFGATLRALVIFAVLLTIDRPFFRFARRTDKVGRRVRIVGLSVGFSTCTAGILVALGYTNLIRVLDVRAAALLLLVGAAVVLRTLHLERPRQDSVLWRLAALLALTLALFWSTALYAYNVGQQIARQVDEAPAHLPVVTVFTREYIDMPGGAVTATRLSSPDGSAVYRYSGMRMLLFSNNRWFLLTGREQRYRSTVAIIHDDSKYHIQIAKQQ